MDFKIKRFNELNAGEVYEILKSRYEIFTVEKGMSCKDIDGRDYDALHCILTNGGRLAAYLRAIPEPSGYRIGRVITLTHGVGNGRVLIQKSIEALQKEYDAPTVYVHAQHDAVGFYEKCGFCTAGDGFIEEGVLHYPMELKTQ